MLKPFASLLCFRLVPGRPTPRTFSLYPIGEAVCRSIRSEERRVGKECLL